MGKKRYLVMAIIVLGAVGAVIMFSLCRKNGETHAVRSFEECVAAGNPVMESYPERCIADGVSYSNPNQVVSPPAENQ
jgi:hypothetical protein